MKKDDIVVVNYDFSLEEYKKFKEFVLTEFPRAEIYTMENDI